MEQQLLQLKEELEAMRDQFTLKTMLLSRKIEALEKEIVASKYTNKSASASTSSSSITVAETIEHDVKVTTQSSDSAGAVSDSADDLYVPQEIQKPQQPSWIETALAQLLSLVFEWFTPATKIYESYKARGMLGIFFLTIAGAGLVLAGFGYAMQLLIDEMGAGSKSLLMSVTAIGVIGGGVALKVKTKFAEFGSAVVALGLLLCFSTIYFVGSVYELIPGAAILLLYAATALACHYLALWLDTKVIAALGIIGVTVMPLLTGSTIIEPTYYIIALLLVTASSLYLAYKYVGHWLADLSFAFAFAALAWVDAANAIYMSAWMINAFYLLFSVYLVLSLFNHRPQTKRYLMLLAAAVGGNLLLLLQGAGYSVAELNIQLVSNAVVSLGIALLFFKVRHKFLSVFVLITASWTVLSIVGLLDATYWGIAWAVEALLLIFMSRQYKLPSLIHQGQGLAVVAIMYCLFAIMPYFPLPALLSTDAWIIVAVLAVVFATWQRLIMPSANTTITSVNYSRYVQTKVYPLLVFIEAAWLSIIALSCAYIWLGEWAGLSAIVIQIAILFRAKVVKSTAANKTSLEVLAVILILFPIAYAVMGSDAVNSLRFSQLPVYAKASIIVAFVQLWLWSAFYRQFNPQSSLRDIAEVARILFYLLLPICWLATAYRRLDEDVLLVLWLSPLLAFLLAHITNAKPLFIESKVLFAALSVITISLLFDNAWGVSVLGLVAYAALIGLAYFLNSTIKSANKFQFVNNWAINSAGLMLAIFSASVFQSLLIPLLVLSIYSLTVIALNKRFELCANNKRFHIVYLAMISLSSWGLLMLEYMLNRGKSIEYALAPLLILIAVFGLKRQGILPLNKAQSTNPTAIELAMHSYLLITYVLGCIAMNKFGFTVAIAPLLAIHGATILFLKNRSKTTVRYSFALILLGIGKLALIDATNVVLWQKVILFMGIGVFILFASFWYQKLVSKETQDIETDGSDREFTEAKLASTDLSEAN